MIVGFGEVDVEVSCMEIVGVEEGAYGVLFAYFDGDWVAYVGEALVVVSDVGFC